MLRGKVVTCYVCSKFDDQSETIQLKDHEDNNIFVEMCNECIKLVKYQLRSVNESV